MKLPKLNPNISIFNSISVVEKLVFTKRLSIMIKSGITLSEATNILAQQTSGYFKTVLEKISEDVANGQSLHKTLAKFPQIFNPLYINLVKIGEDSGTLEQNLDYLAIQIRKNYEFKNKIQTAMLYPIIILIATFIAGTIVSIFVLPRLIDLFNSLEIKLPLSTRILIAIATIMRDYGIAILIGFVGFIILTRILIQLPLIRPYWDTFLLRIPFLSQFIQSAELSSFCRNMGMMLKTGMPIMSALNTQYDATSNSIFKNYIGHMREGVEKGKDIESTFKKGHFQYFPEVAIKIIGIGEKTGKLDESLTYLGDFFEDEVDVATRNFSATMEPLILLIVGLIVAFFAISIIGPIYQFTGSIQRQ